MAILHVEVSSKMADKFKGRDIVSYREILDYEDELVYNFSDQKVGLEDLSNFLGDVISSNNSKVC